MLNWAIIGNWHNWVVVAFALVLGAALLTIIQPFKGQLSTIGAFDDGF